MINHEELPIHPEHSPHTADFIESVDDILVSQTRSYVEEYISHAIGFGSDLHGLRDPRLSLTTEFSSETGMLVAVHTQLRPIPFYVDHFYTSVHNESGPGDRIRAGGISTHPLSASGKHKARASIRNVIIATLEQKMTPERDQDEHLQTLEQVGGMILDFIDMEAAPQESREELFNFSGEFECTPPIRPVILANPLRPRFALQATMNQVLKAETGSHWVLHTSGEIDGGSINIRRAIPYKSVNNWETDYARQSPLVVVTQLESEPTRVFSIRHPLHEMYIGLERLLRHDDEENSRIVTEAQRGTLLGQIEQAFS